MQSAGDRSQQGFDGVVEAVRQSVVAAQVAGAIVALDVKAGDQVKAGQTLARIDARAAEQNASASDAQVRSAQALLDVASKDFERQKQLFDKQYISQAALERAESQFKASQAQAAALLAQANAARTQSGLHVVRAPFAGVVADVPVALGDMALPGKPLLTLYEPGALRVTVALPQSQVAAVPPGLKVEFPGLPEARRWWVPAAQQVQLLPTVDAATHTVQLRITLPAAQQGLAPGTFARVWLPMTAAGAPSRLYVPASAVVRRAEMTGCVRGRRQGCAGAASGAPGPCPGQQRRGAVRRIGRRTRRAGPAGRGAGRLSRTMHGKLGVSGRIAAFFQSAQITPLLALVALLLGIFAVLVTPREEEPQINVTMANVLIPFPGAGVADVEQMVATPAEQVLSQIAGIEHVMSVSRPGLAVITVQFKVGVPRTEALVRLYDTVNSNADWLPKGLGVLDPIIKPKGIDDVPIVTLTLFSRKADTGAFDLERVAHSIEAELKRVPGTREVVTIGGPGRAVRGGDRSGAHGQPRRHRPRPARRAAVGQPRPAGGRAAGRATARWRSNPAPS